MREEKEGHWDRVMGEWRWNVMGKGVMGGSDFFLFFFGVGSSFFRLELFKFDSTVEDFYGS